MIAILEKYEHNQDFHQIVDFVEASHIRFALTFNPTVYVSRIRQFWSTARIETTEEGTKILATVDGKLRIISESCIRRNLKLNDEAGISSLPDAELFENLTLTGYNISSNQKFTFHKGQFSRTPTEPHHTPSPKAQQTLPTTHSSPSLPPVPTEPLSTVIPTDTPQLRHYTRRARIAQSSALPPVADEHASPIGDVSQGEACPTDSGLETDQDRENIPKTSTLPSDSTPRVTSLDADEDTSILTSGGVQVVPTATEVATATVSIPTGSGVVSTASLLFTLVAREWEEEMARDAQRMNEQIARDAEIARIHAEEELQTMIDGLDRTNETVAKYLQEYHQFATELPIGKRIELISDLVKYQENYAKVLRYQTQQRKPLTKKQHREFYTSVLRNQAGWKAKHFKGMTLEEIKKKFDPVWKQIQDFIPIGSKEEAERFKRKGLRLEQESGKNLKTSKEVKNLITLRPILGCYNRLHKTRHASARRDASAGRADRDPDRRKRESRNLVRSYVTCSNEGQTEIEREWDAIDRANRRKPTRDEECYLSESENDGGGHWKSKKPKPPPMKSIYPSPGYVRRPIHSLYQSVTSNSPRGSAYQQMSKHMTGPGIQKTTSKYFKPQPSNIHGAAVAAGNETKSYSKLLRKSGNLIPTTRKYDGQESRMMVRAKAGGHLIHRILHHGKTGRRRSAHRDTSRRRSFKTLNSLHGWVLMLRRVRSWTHPHKLIRNGVHREQEGRHTQQDRVHQLHSPNQTGPGIEYVVREIHEWSCIMHSGLRFVVTKAIRSGDNHFKDWCNKLNIKQRFASIKHPQTNRLVERANYSLGEGTKERLDQGSKNWFEEVPYVLWAHRTMIKTSNNHTPFSMTYGTEVVILVEIGMPLLKCANVDQVLNDEALLVNLDILEEKRERVAILEAKSKAKMEKYCNAKVHGTIFKPGDFVYRNNEASHTKESGKLGPKWEGPYEVVEALGKGSYKIGNGSGDILSRT
nr:reverse transcriptase domain-containing protein [Tanacetum cinerariifolium]